MVFIEKEVKLLDIDLIQTISRLEALWATKKYDTVLYDVYFDTDANTYGSQRKNIRIRFTSQWDVLTLKHRIPAKDYKAAYEDEYEVNGLQASSHLADQGYVPKRAKYKRRISYQYEWLTFDIDMYPNIPPLLEIEALTLQEIRRWVKLLWLQKNSTATCGARWLFRRYNRVVDTFPIQN